MSSLSTHVLDATTGRPARDVSLLLSPFAYSTYRGS
jgi:5-hydroxyisourate hydrolase-like protein (transthyretin family)